MDPVGEADLFEGPAAGRAVVEYAFRVRAEGRPPGVGEGVHGHGGAGYRPDTFSAAQPKKYQIPIPTIFNKTT